MIDRRVGSPRQRPTGGRLLVLGDGRTRGQSLPFGADHLRNLGHEVVHPRRTASGVCRKLRDVVEHRSGVLVEDSLRSWWSRPDIVLALLDHNAEFPLRARRFGLHRRARLVVLVCWAAERMRHLEPPARRRYADRLNRADVLLVLSHNQIALLREFGVDRPEVHAIPFGVDTDFYTPTSPAATRDGLVAFGVDGGRDYATLCRAVAGTGIAVDLYCAEWNLDGLDLPTEVRWRGTVPHEDYRAALQASRAVVVPTHELAYPTGQSVALEGAACGACVVTTSTIPLREYFTHDRTALMSPPGDVEALRANLVRVTTGEDWRDVADRGSHHVRTRHSTRQMWEAADRYL